MISRGRAAETAAQSGSRRSRRFKVSRRPVLSVGIDPSNGGLLGDLMLESVKCGGSVPRLGSQSNKGLKAEG